MKFTLTDMAKVMRDIDFAMLFTRSEGGELAGRPMSNNQEVDYDGDSYFFTYEDTRTVRDIRGDNKVGLSYQSSAGILGTKPVFIAVEGRASVIKNVADFEKHWSKGLGHWFEQGVDTPGLVLIKVAAERVHYWEGGQDTEINVYAMH